MNTVEARRVLSERLACYRHLSYSDLVGRIGTVECEEIANSSQRLWQLEFQFFWDNKPNGDVRVMGAIDDGGIRAFVPVTDSFIKAPNGEFVDD
jgi:hypothetical protein